MSLRSRLAVSVAALVAVAIALSGWIIVDSAERELTQEVDAFLENRTDSVVGLNLLAQRGRGDLANGFPGVGREPRRFGLDSLSEDDSVTQLITPDGQTQAFGDVTLPVGPSELQVAAGTSRARFGNVVVDGTEFRVKTTPLVDGVALMVGRDLSEVDAALDGLTRRTIVLGLIGSGLAAIVAWGLASGLARPVKRLAMAAEHVAETQDLSSSIEIGGGTEVARLADSFNTMLSALDTSREQQHRLVMDASHELRTPLTSIRTNVDVLRRAKGIDPESHQALMSDLSAEVDELTGLVTELVDLATASQRADEPDEEVDLSELARAVASRAERRSGRRVEVNTVDRGTIVGNSSSLERAISNLVDNAIKFSDADVTVTVDRGRCVVRDRGPGVDPADRALIFDRFFRSTATRSAPGSGLGLSIVKEIVTLHGGTVVVEEPSDGGPGAVIGFALS